MQKSLTKTIVFHSVLAAVLAVAISLTAATLALAETSKDAPSFASLLSAPSSGFSLSTDAFSSSIKNSFSASNLDRPTDIVGDQRAYALLIDGKYDFKYDELMGSSFHPYLSGGVGMALVGKPIGTSVGSNLTGDTVPLMRMGGGVTYRLDEKWDMDLGYKTGLSGNRKLGDTLFTGRGQEAIDMQTVNMGVKYQF
jgi:opacity protein-like surface antigen